MPSYRSREAFYSSSPSRKAETESMSKVADQGSTTHSEPSKGEHVGNFFSRTKYSFGRKRSPSALSTTGSTMSDKSSRTVESLRSAPVLDLDWADPLGNDDESHLSIADSIRLSCADAARTPPASPSSIRKDQSASNKGFSSPKSVIDVLADGGSDDGSEHSTRSDSPLPMEPSGTLPQPIKDTPSNDDSLSPEDVEFLLTSIKRVAGDDFQKVVSSIKNKQDPNICVAAPREGETPSPAEAGLDLENNSPATVENVESLDSADSGAVSATVSLEPANDPLACVQLQADNEDEDSSDDDSDSSWGLSMPFQNMNFFGTSKSPPPNKGGKPSRSDGERVTNTKSLMRSAMPPRAPTSPAATLPRKISFSAQDNVRFYNLTQSEIQHKMMRDEANDDADEDEEDDILGEADEYEETASTTTTQVDVPHMFCVPKSHMNDAADLLVRLYSEGLETAKSVQLKCKEDGWFEGNVFGCGTSCDVSREPEATSLDTLMNFFPIVEASESAEGLFDPTHASARTGEMMNPFRADQSQVVWLDAATDLFQNFSGEREEDFMIKVGSLSFGSRETSELMLKARRMASFGSVGLGSDSGRQVGRGRSHIHLLEVDEEEDCILLGSGDAKGEA